MRHQGIQAHALFKLFCSDVTTTTQAKESRRGLRDRAERKKVGHLPVEVCILVLRGNSTRIARRRAGRTIRRSYSAGCFWACGILAGRGFARHLLGIFRSSRESLFWTHLGSLSWRKVIKKRRGRKSDKSKYRLVVASKMKAEFALDTAVSQSEEH